MLVFYIIIGIFLSISILYIVNKFKGNVNEKKIELIAKILSLLFVFISFIDLFLPDAFSLRMIDIDETFTYLKEHHDSFHAICRSFNAMAVVVIPIAIFFNGKKNINRITSFIILPTVILNIIVFKDYLNYFTSPITLSGYNDGEPGGIGGATVFGDYLWPFLTNAILRSSIFGIIMGLELMLSIYILLNNVNDLKMELKEVPTFILLSIGFYFTNLPIYTIQQLLGTVSSITFNFGDISHIIFIIFIPVYTLLLTLIFKNQSNENKYILLLVMSISLMFQYNTFFKTDGIITATRYPLQLCNIAGAFLIVTLLTRSEKMFHFTVVCNVTGALIAIILCDSTQDVGILYSMNIHYMVEHINVFVVPILGLTLGVFKPLKPSDVKHFIVGFTIYYISILILGTIFNGLDNMYSQLDLYKAKGLEDGYFNCNYLFMFQREAAERLVGESIGILFDYKITILNYFNLYLVQAAVYIVFLGVCTGVFFVLYIVFKEKKNKVLKP